MPNFFCPVSYSKNYKKIFSIKSFPIFMGTVKNNSKYEFKNLNWWINKDTGNVQIHPKISLNKLYLKSHNSGTVGKVWSDHHELFYRIVKPYLKGNICEIGGGNNSILNKISNFSKLNFFFSFDKNLNIKLKNSKIKKIKDFFDIKYFQNQKNHIKIDLLVHSHTFEHLYDPNKFLSDVRSILGPNGKHIFTMPNMHPMIKKGYANAMNFEHPYYCDEKLVDFLLYKNGFKIIKKKFYKEDHSIMYITEKSNNSSIKVSDPKKKYLMYKYNLKTFLSMFDMWEKDILKINKNLNNHEKIFIFGAHIFSQMMLFNGLNKKKIFGILDNDKKKINKYLYGTNFKIFSPDVLKETIKPCVILRAGSYNEEIKKQLFKINKEIIIV